LNGARGDQGLPRRPLTPLRWPRAHTATGGPRPACKTGSGRLPSGARYEGRRWSWSGVLALDALDGLGGADDDDAGPAADGLAFAQHVVVVAGDEGVVAGHAVGSEVLHVGDLAAVEGQQRRVVLVPVPRLESLGQEDLAEGGVGGGVVVVGEPIKATQHGVAEPERAADAADDRPLLAEPGEVALVLVGRRPFLVDAKRGGDPQADPALAGEVDQFVDLGAVRLGLAAWMTLLVSRVSRSMAASMPSVRRPGPGQPVNRARSLPDERADDPV
jgi:hypothetical protein